MKYRYKKKHLPTIGHIPMRLLEAARRVFSSFNNQMWRFVYAKRNTEHWTQLSDLLCEGNRLRAEDIAALVVVVSRKTFEYDGRHPITHQFDADAVRTTSSYKSK